MLQDASVSAPPSGDDLYGEEIAEIYDLIYPFPVTDQIGLMEALPTLHAAADRIS